MLRNNSEGRKHLRHALHAKREVVRMEHYVEKILLNADAKALATYHDGNLNVIPVSTVKVVDGNILLVDYFMEKTVQNVQKNESVALVFWKDMKGFQIKGRCDYQTTGRYFDDTVEWAKEAHPDRTVKGILLITPQEVHDIAPDKSSGE